MRVAILTQPLKGNYGGMLQAYALQQVLKDLGHEPITIDRQFAKKSFWRSWLSLIKFHVRQRILGEKDVRMGGRNDAIVYAETLRFIRQSIKLSEPLFDGKGMLKHFKCHAYDAVVVGSDQTWRLEYSPDIENFYLDFLIDMSVYKMAYAASFGTDEWGYDQALTQRCGSLLRRFDVVSVREQSAVELCKDKFNVAATLVLDPTMLMGAAEYISRLALPVQEMDPAALFTYILDDNDFRRKVVSQVSELFGLMPFTNQPSLKIGQGGSRDPRDFAFPSVESWVSAFQRSAYVVTDSFHGCVFAILFNKPFVVVGNAYRGMARFTTLLKVFGLERRLVSPSQSDLKGVICEPIDWPRVNKVLLQRRSESILFLRNSLSGREVADDS